MNKFLSSIFALLLLALGATSCFPTAERVPPIGSVSVVFPSDDSNLHWHEEQSAMINYLSSLNFEVYYARAKDGDGEEQAKQIKQMQDWGVEYIVLASVDTYSKEINDALDAYVSAGGRVICYDRLQQHSTSILAYVSSSYKTIGELQIAAFDKLTEGAKVEILAGPAYDVNAKTMFDAASEIFSYFFTNGMWICPSGNMTYDQTKMADWSKDAAFTYAKKLFATSYAGLPLPDAILVGNDAQAAGVAQAIAEITPTVEKYPLITGLDNSEAAWVRIVSDRQTMTVYKDVSKFITESAELLIKMVKKQSISASQSVNNGSIEVPYVEVQGLKAIYKKDIIKQ